MGLLPKELKEGGFTLEEIKHAGYTVWQLRENFPAWMLIGKLRSPGSASARGNGQASSRSLCFTLSSTGSSSSRRRWSAATSAAR